MLIVKIQGGLGNQMFQYAAGKSLALKLNRELKLDISIYINKSKSVTPRKYELKYFKNIEDEIASDKEIKAVGFITRSASANYLFRHLRPYLNFLKKSHLLQKEVEFSDTGTLAPRNFPALYLEGYWQSEAFFNENKGVIREKFDLSYLADHKCVKQYMAQIESSYSVSIHVRRGDYITNKRANSYHGVCDIDYYNRAIRKIIDLIKTVPTFFIFSDDLDWCKVNLQSSYETYYIKTDLAIYDLYLMSKCKSNIIANSSFSWWSAWLNSHQDKKVIAPKNWFKDIKANAASVYNILPEDWITI